MGFPAISNDEVDAMKISKPKAKRMNSDKRLFVLEVVYWATKRLFVFETRTDMIDFDRIVSARKGVIRTNRRPAQRGPSNVVRRAR